MFNLFNSKSLNELERYSLETVITISNSLIPRFTEMYVNESFVTLPAVYQDVKVIRKGIKKLRRILSSDICNYLSKRFRQREEKLEKYVKLQRENPNGLTHLTTDDVDDSLVKDLFYVSQLGDLIPKLLKSEKINLGEYERGIEAKYQEWRNFSLIARKKKKESSIAMYT